LPFTATNQNQIHLWLGDPTCQGAHDALLGRLVEINSNFIPPGAMPTDIVRGNLGEFIALRIAQKTFSATQTFAPNAIQPLNSASISGVDLTYLMFHANDSSLDMAFIQEVKTTGQSSLAYADKLIVDYDKLFGTNVNFTLESRLQAISNSLEIERQRPDLVARVIELNGTTAQSCPRIRLIPTLVHERSGTQPVQKMIAIRQAIASKGWPSASIEAWAVALTDLDQRLIRLARGQS
jgi:hypothetical protein